MASNLLPHELLSKPDISAIKSIGVCSHTDEVTSADIFIAQGSGQHHHIQQALDKGAVAVICQSGSCDSGVLSKSGKVYEVECLDDFVGVLLAEVYGNDIADIDLIGVTGTNGKTSCAHFASQIFNLLEDKTGYIGTLGYGVVNNSLHKSRNTTPDRITLYRYIALLYRSGCKRIVMEVSSHAITLGRIAGLEFSIGVFTNLSRDHLDFHSTMQAYEAAKLSFFSDYKINHLIVNSDDMVGEKLLNKWRNSLDNGLSCYGRTESKTDDFYQYEFARYAGAGDNRIKVRHGDAGHDLGIRLVGQYNIENMMAAVLICHAAGHALSEIEKVTALVSPVPGRLECSKASNGLSLCVDYAHTPAAMEVVLNDVSLLPEMTSVTWCVFGCGGDRDEGKRPIMGEVASRCAEHVVISDDNVRREQAESILCDIVSGVANKQGLMICRDRSKSIEHVMRLADKDDLALVLGKGDESFMDYGTYRIQQRDMDSIVNSAVLQ